MLKVGQNLTYSKWHSKQFNTPSLLRPVFILVHNVVLLPLLENLVPEDLIWSPIGLPRVGTGVLALKKHRWHSQKYLHVSFHYLWFTYSFSGVLSYKTSVLFFHRQVSFVRRLEISTSWTFPFVNTKSHWTKKINLEKQLFLVDIALGTWHLLNLATC